MNDAVERFVALFEGLTPADVERLGEFYTEDCWFKDPFNEVRGLAAVQNVFRHMYRSLESPRFVVTARVVDGAQCFLAWEFHFRFQRFHKGIDQVVRGGSHLLLADDGRVRVHRDYWDAAEELYGKLPLLGGLMRWLQRQANR